MNLNQAFSTVVEQAHLLTDEQVQKLEFVVWSESMERFVATGEVDVGPESYDEIRGY